MTCNVSIGTLNLLYHTISDVQNERLRYEFFNKFENYSGCVDNSNSLMVMLFKQLLLN